MPSRTSFNVQNQNIATCQAVSAVLPSSSHVLFFSCPHLNEKNKNEVQVNLKTASARYFYSLYMWSFIILSILLYITV
jgi:hypothetical protein